MKKILFFIFPILLLSLSYVRVNAYDYTDDLGTILGGIIVDAGSVADIIHPNERPTSYDNTFEYGNSIHGGSMISVVSMFYDMAEGTSVRVRTIRSSDNSSILLIDNKYVITSKSLGNAYQYSLEHNLAFSNSTSSVFSDNTFTSLNRDLQMMDRFYKVSDVLNTGFLVLDSNGAYVLNRDNIQSFMLLTPYYTNVLTWNSPVRNQECLVSLGSVDRNAYNGHLYMPEHQLFNVGTKFSLDSSDWSYIIPELNTDSDVLGGRPSDIPETLTTPTVTLKFNTIKSVQRTFVDEVYLKIAPYNSALYDVEFRFNMGKFYDFTYSDVENAMLGYHPKYLYQGYSKSYFMNSEVASSYWDANLGLLYLGRNMGEYYMSESSSYSGFLQPFYDTIKGVESFNYDSNISKQKRASASALTDLRAFVNPYTTFTFQVRLIDKQRENASKWVQISYNPLHEGQYSSSGYFDSDGVASDDVDWENGQGSSHLNYNSDSDGNKKDPYNTFSDDPDKSFFEFLLDKLGVGKLTNGLGQMFDTLGGLIRTIINGIGSVPYLIAQVFAWLPSWFNTLFACSIALVIVLRILGR